MILTLVFGELKYFTLGVLLVFVLVYVKYRKAMTRIRNVVSQNEGCVFMLPTTDTPIIGHIKGIIQATKAAEASPEPTRTLFDWVMNKMSHADGKGRFTGSDYPLVISQMFGKVYWTVSEPEILEQLCTKYTNQLEKPTMPFLMTKELLGSSFLMVKGDETWKAKRRACAHAFYKDKLEAMIDISKGQAQNRLQAWLHKMA